jgi:hypothetical protein
LKSLTVEELRHVSRGLGLSRQQNKQGFLDAVLLLFKFMSSVEDNQVRLTIPDRAKRRFPTPIALLQNDFVSCTANPASTAAARTPATSGHKR